MGSAFVLRSLAAIGRTHQAGGIDLAFKLREQRVTGGLGPGRAIDCPPPRIMRGGGGLDAGAKRHGGENLSVMRHPPARLSVVRRRGNCGIPRDSLPHNSFRLTCQRYANPIAVKVPPPEWDSGAEAIVAVASETHGQRPSAADSRMLSPSASASRNRPEPLHASTLGALKAIWC